MSTDTNEATIEPIQMLYLNAAHLLKLISVTIIEPIQMLYLNENRGD
ncbi:MAG: Unknown protein [uncultured Sulfurovum sp.]|uniref:Uncharacterized protein n=1 Tax=uncultured Sulfurovum sp. TaxID=269237 RepID=A0A6S6TDV3_9BACT|nr:MAG: Unknown protein [uncultured Sulfurovum sp.]